MQVSDKRWVALVLYYSSSRLCSLFGYSDRYGVADWIPFAHFYVRASSSFG